MQNLSAPPRRVKPDEQNIAFQNVNRRLLSQAPQFLLQLFPLGVLKPPRFYIGSLSGEAGKSLVVHLTRGFWIDFATGQKGGDLISLYAALHNISQTQALQTLNKDY